jgi:hypothetical protein
MNRSQRKDQAPEATQELRSLDVMDILQTLAPQPAGPRASHPSSSSIAPVGLDLMPSAPRTEAASPNSTLQTTSVSIQVPRRRLGGVVAVTVVACALILVAAGIARVGHASSQPPPVVAAAATTVAATPTEAPAAEPSASAVPPTPAPVASGAPAEDDRSTGKVRLEKPALPKRTWLDGKKMTSSSAVVSCGTHQIRVGFRRTHSIDVPCGGEVAVSK